MVEFKKRVIHISDNERVPQTMEVSSIFHFFGEHVGWVNFSNGVSHIDNFFLDPFMDWIFLELNVVSCFRSHIVWPLYTSVIIVIQDRGRGDVVESVAIVRNTVWEISKVHWLFWGNVSSSNLGLTQAERGPFLTFPKPFNGATVLENHATVHTSELEEREKAAFCDRIANQKTPIHIAVSQDGVGVGELQRNCIGVSFDMV
jgi:hypothetical protein